MDWSLRGEKSRKRMKFNNVQKICKYYTFSYDWYRDKHEDACHYKWNIPDGDSWGQCNEDNCPFCKDENNLMTTYDIDISIIH